MIRVIAALLVSLPLVAFAAEHGGSAAEHGGKPAEHGGQAAEAAPAAGAAELCG